MWWMGTEQAKEASDLLKYIGHLDAYGKTKEKREAR
jgi:hypothetical protein